MTRQFWRGEPLRAAVDEAGWMVEEVVGHDGAATGQPGSDVRARRP